MKKIDLSKPAPKALGEVMKLANSYFNNSIVPVAFVDEEKIRLYKSSILAAAYQKYNPGKYKKWNGVLNAYVQVLKNKEDFWNMKNELANLWCKRYDYLVDPFFLPYRGTYGNVVKFEEIKTGLRLEA